MYYIMDLWCLFAILCAGGVGIAIVQLFWAMAAWAADEWRRFRRDCRRRARLKIRAQEYRAAAKKKAAVRRI